MFINKLSEALDDSLEAAAKDIVGQIQIIGQLRTARRLGQRFNPNEMKAAQNKLGVAFKQAHSRAVAMGVTIDQFDDIVDKWLDKFGIQSNGDPIVNPMFHSYGSETHPDVVPPHSESSIQRRKIIKEVDNKPSIGATKYPLDPGPAPKSELGDNLESGSIVPGKDSYQWQETYFNALKQLGARADTIIEKVKGGIMPLNIAVSTLKKMGNAINEPILSGLTPEKLSKLIARYDDYVKEYEPWDLDDIRSRMREGWTLDEVAKATGQDMKALQQIILHGSDPSDKEETFELMVYMRNRGLSLDEIGSAFGVDANVIKRKLMMRGLGHKWVERGPVLPNTVERDKDRRRRLRAIGGVHEDSI